MTSNKESQAARNAADRRLREHFIHEYSQYMQEEYAKRGLTWIPRATKEQREERIRQAQQDKARARIQAEAQKAGITVAFVDIPEGHHFEIDPKTEGIHRAKEFIVEGRRDIA